MTQGEHTIFQPAFIATEAVFSSCLISSMILNIFMCPFRIASFVKNVDVHSQKDYCTCVCATLKVITPCDHLEAV